MTDFSKYIRLRTFEDDPPNTSNQLYHNGDLVTVTRKSHVTFESQFYDGCEAIILGSYADANGGDTSGGYRIYTQHGGESAWWNESEIRLIRRGAHDLLAQWENDMANNVAQWSDLDWIFANGPEVAASPTGASVQALFSCIAEGSLWGSRGEGLTWAVNAHRTMQRAIPFLIKKDKAGWLAYSEKYKTQKSLDEKAEKHNLRIERQ